uniref:Uncharacterized protein n=1 Tax=Strigamia maritima TaxID=126957 RepID=T1JEG7_STRMM
MNLGLEESFRSDDWVFDTGASSHICRNRTLKQCSSRSLTQIWLSNDSGVYEAVATNKFGSGHRESEFQVLIKSIDSEHDNSTML